MSKSIQNNRRTHRDSLGSNSCQQESTELPSAMLDHLEGDVARMMELLQKVQKLRHHLINDDLTGLLRRNEFFRRLDSMVSARSGDVSVILLDIDNFKRINDEEGHIVGDHVLQRVSRVLHRTFKAGAEAGRFGGEEFVVAISVSQERAAVLAEALRRQIQREVNVTVSVGVATARAADWEVRKMVGMADQALYRAKNAGKNQVRIAA